MLTSDFDSMVSDVSMEIWNTLIHQADFNTLEPIHYVDLLDAVREALKKRLDRC